MLRTEYQGESFRATLRMLNEHYASLYVIRIFACSRNNPREGGYRDSLVTGKRTALLQALEHTVEQTVPLVETMVRNEDLRDIRLTSLHPKSRAVGQEIRGSR